MDPTGVMWLHVLAGTSATAFGFVAARALRRPRVQEREHRYEASRWVKSVIPLSMLAGLAVVNTQADVIMLGWLTTADKVGHYRIAIQGASLAGIGLVSFNMVLGPHFSRLNALGDHAGLQRLVSR